METNATTIYVIYAEDDSRFCDLLMTQAKNAKLRVEFVHMPSKQPWVPRWKATCRVRVFQCDGAIVLLSKKTHQDAGTKTELDFVLEARLPLLGVYMEGYRGTLPDQVAKKTLIDWNAAEVMKFIQSIGQSGKPATAP